MYSNLSEQEKIEKKIQAFIHILNTADYQIRYFAIDRLFDGRSTAQYFPRTIISRHNIKLISSFILQDTWKQFMNNINKSIPMKSRHSSRDYCMFIELGIFYT